MTDQGHAGHRLFAQYAYAPNALGYCGPQGSAALCAVACGEGAGVPVVALARRFSGAWPYQQVLAELAGVADPLDACVVRGYWTGNELTDRVDRVEFGAALVARIRSVAGGYWSHLGDELLREAAPTHAFHVLGVYPWSRLLGGSGHDQALQVLDSCRIGWGRVVAVEPDELVITARRLQYAEGVLSLSVNHEARVGYRVDGASFLDQVEVDDMVAVHWGFACDRLTAAQAGTLQRWTTWQLDAMAPRLAAQ